MATRPVTARVRSSVDHEADAKAGEERAGTIVTGKLKAYDLPKIHWRDVPGLNARPSRTFARLGPVRQDRPDNWGQTRIKSKSMINFDEMNLERRLGV